MAAVHALAIGGVAASFSARKEIYSVVRAGFRKMGRCLAEKRLSAWDFAQRSGNVCSTTRDMPQ